MPPAASAIELEKGRVYYDTVVRPNQQRFMGKVVSLLTLDDLYGRMG